MPNVAILCRVRAIYTFESTDKSSLDFIQGETIDVLTKLPSGWWDGICNGARGWFPSNYVQVIESFEQMPPVPDSTMTPNLSTQDVIKKWLFNTDSDSPYFFFFIFSWSKT
ncbi:SH3-domain-containing protein [Hesseltinella vesiculosa]|uniref:SH3-domain-containing protein n=1 Tax=Hesseltinella vesiculosa TaxID=101127 RepID=A0A1X2GFH4_9FUNG|nr:SH3-domain-containing protein [Hesseltinella vesiculosa]